MTDLDPRSDDERTPVTRGFTFEGTSGKRPCLVRLTGAQLGEVAIVRGELYIGREPEHGISLPHDRAVSRVHCKLVEIGDSALVIDLGSTNGTFVDGVRVKEHLLSDGEKIRVGQTSVLKFARLDDSELRMQRNLVEEALRDGLTRVFNRRYFMQRLDGELGYAQRHRQPLALVLFDLDHFKAFNDQHGHLAGDRALCDVVRVCDAGVRHEDVLARYGGEEFVILLRGTTLEGALRVAERLRAAVEGARLAAVPITISVGVAAFLPGEHRPVELVRDQLIAATDEALYRAKDAGRNRVSI